MNWPERIPHAAKQSQRRSSPKYLADIFQRYGISKPAGGGRVQNWLDKKIIQEVSGLQVIVNTKSGRAFLDPEKYQAHQISDVAIEIVAQYGKLVRKLPNDSELRRISPDDATKLGKRYSVSEPDEGNKEITEAVRLKRYKEKVKKPWQLPPEENLRRKEL